MRKTIKGRLKRAISEFVPVKEYKAGAQGGKRTDPELPMDRRLWKFIRRMKHFWTRLESLREVIVLKKSSESRLSKKEDK